MKTELDKLFTHTFKDWATLTEVTDEGIEFSDGTTLCHFDKTNQSYVDWDAIKGLVKRGDTFRGLHIRGIKGKGIRIKLGVLIPVFGSNPEGLLLRIETRPGLEYKIDISNYRKPL